MATAGDYWRRAIEQERENQRKHEQLRRMFEEIVKEEKAKLGQWDMNEFGPECP